MINRNAKGHRKEKRCYDDLKAEGYSLLWKTIRHKFLNIDLFGLFDVLACDGVEFRFIQVKTGYVANTVREAIRKIKLPSNCKKEIWAWFDNEGWRREIL